MQKFTDVSLTAGDDLVATVEIRRPPENFFDATLIAAIAELYEDARSVGARAIVLCSEGKHFCAGADFWSSASLAPSGAARVHGSIAGAAGMLAGPDSPLDGTIAEILVSVPGISIAGGTDEIQHTIIGERVVGLPREPDASKELPFRQVPR